MGANPPPGGDSPGPSPAKPRRAAVLLARLRRAADDEEGLEDAPAGAAHEVMTAPPADETPDQSPAHCGPEGPELLTEPAGAVVELRALSADEHAGPRAFIANRGSGALHRLELHVVGGARQTVSVVEVDLPTPTLLPGEACVIGLPQPPQRHWGLRLTWLTDHGPGQSATVLSGADETAGHCRTRTAPKVQVTP